MKRQFQGKVTLKKMRAFQNLYVFLDSYFVQFLHITRLNIYVFSIFRCLTKLKLRYIVLNMKGI